MGRSSCSGEDNPFCPPNLLHVDILDPGRGDAASRGHHAAFLLARG